MDMDMDMDMDMETDASTAGEQQDQTFDLKKLLTGFHAADANHIFTTALSNLPFPHFPVNFSFPDSRFSFRVDRLVLCQRGLLFLAGQVVFARNELRMRALLEELEGMEGVEDGR